MCFIVIYIFIIRFKINPVFLYVFFQIFSSPEVEPEPKVEDKGDLPVKVSFSIL